MALRHAEWTKSTRTAPAAHSVNLGKTYGTGQAAVQAHDDADPACAG
jgi:hypothetical protein